METAKGRKNGTAKSSTQKVKVKEITVVIEVPEVPHVNGGPPIGNADIPDPPATGKVHFIANNGVKGWEPSP